MRNRSALWLKGMLILAGVLLITPAGFAQVNRIVAEADGIT